MLHESVLVFLNGQLLREGSDHDYVFSHDFTAFAIDQALVPRDNMAIFDLNHLHADMFSNTDIRVDTFMQRFRTEVEIVISIPMPWPEGEPKPTRILGGTELVLDTATGKLIWHVPFPEEVL